MQGPNAAAPGHALLAAVSNGLGDDQFVGCRLRGKIRAAMPTDLTVILEHRPGELARLGNIGLFAERWDRG
jgi:hypothetical protein